MKIYLPLCFFLYINSCFSKECPSFKELFSSNQKIHLIEFYTSEGCSSCPSAESWLNSLYGHKDLYQKFIPLVFHVNYWDYIGHKDKMASDAYTQRQRDYARKWGSSNIYTPGFVLDGQEWRIKGSRIAPHELGEKE